MTLADQYLLDGERSLFSIEKKNLLSTEEIVATDDRILHVKGKNFYDISYEHITSIGCYALYEWKWAILSLISLLAAFVLLGVSAFVPENFMAVSLASLINLISFVGTVFLLLAISFIFAFFIASRRGIIIKTPSGPFYFEYRKKQQDDAVHFARVVRDTGTMKARENTPGSDEALWP